MGLFGLRGALAIAIAMLFLPAPAPAQGIGYTASFALPSNGPFTTIGSLGLLNDNSYAPVGIDNGFAVDEEKAGTLSFTFAGSWDLTNFTIWNNINKTWGGVTAFQLRFYDGNNIPLGTRTFANVSRLEAPTSVAFAMHGVHRVDMVISNSNIRIEIREVQFQGTRSAPPPISTCCPPSATFALPAMFNSVQGNVAGKYRLNFAMNPAFDAQMAAYAALLRALDPSITAMGMAVRAYDGGSASAPLIAGAPLQVGAIFWVPPPGSNGNSWPLPAFFTSAADLPVNRWTVVEVTSWAQRAETGSVKLCDTRLFAFRPASGFVPYTGPVPGAPPPPAAMPPRR